MSDPAGKTYNLRDTLKRMAKAEEPPLPYGGVSGFILTGMAFNSWQTSGQSVPIISRYATKPTTP